MLSQLDRQFFKRQFKILPANTTKWHKQQFVRLLALLKIPETIQKQFVECTPDQNEIKNLNTIIQKIQGLINQNNYFAFQKLKCAVSFILSSVEDDSSQSSLFQKNLVEQTQQINIDEEAVKALTQNIKKYQDLQIIQFTSTQISALMKTCKLDNHAILIKKLNIDGFNLICSLSDFDVIKDIRNYFSHQQISIIMETSYLFLTQYFRQTMMELSRRDTSVENTKKTSQQEQSFEDNFDNIVKQYVIESNDLSKKNSEDDIQVDFENTSEMGESVMGNSQMGQSQFASSERGSVYADSEYASSVRGSVDCRMSFRVANNDGRASLMYNSQIINQLKQVCLNLSFDLLNLQCIRQIKLRSLKSAFGKQMDKDFWIYSVQGAKLGRDKDNDLRFPDELSISGKHAQIFFKVQNFYLQDLGSKTGTYLRIQRNIPLEQETYIQFSTQVQILFRIIKKANNEGIIKAEIKKPQNLPDYKISLREGYKIKIGRSDKCHIRINNSSLADKHSQIFYKDCTFYFKNTHLKYLSWLRLSQKSVRSEMFKLFTGDIFRLSSKKSFIVQQITGEIQKIKYT